MTIFKSHYRRLITMAFSPRGDELAVLSAENEKLALEIWDVRDPRSQVLALTDLADGSGKETQTVEEDAPEALLRWSQHGTYLALARRDGVVDVWFVAMSEHLLSFRLEGGCQTLAWGNIHPCLAVSSKTRLLYWTYPYPSSSTELSLPLREESGVLYPLHLTTLAFSPDDTSLICGGRKGELIWWESRPHTSLAYSGYAHAPHPLPIVHLCSAPDGTRLLVEQDTQGDNKSGVPWRARSLLFGDTHNWLSFGEVAQDFIGWSANSQRLLGTRQSHEEDHLWIEQRDAWTGACLARTPIGVSPRDLQIISLADKGTQIVWCVKHPELLSYNLEVDSIPL